MELVSGLERHNKLANEMFRSESFSSVPLARFCTNTFHRMMMAADAACPRATMMITAAAVAAGRSLG